MRHLNVRQRVALSIGVAAVALAIGRGIERRFVDPEGWFGYAPNTSIRVAPYDQADAIVWTAWWVAVIVVTTVVVLAILRDPPPD